MFEWNISSLCESYKDIKKTCIDDGYLIPFNLVTVNIPLEYDYTDKEWDKLVDKLSDRNYDKIKKSMIQRRNDELKLFSRYGKDIDNFQIKMDEYYENELRSFIKKYPRFKTIIK
jgi:hypothetical protein